MRALDLTGQVFGRLTALSRSKRTAGKAGVFWDCLCACGETTCVLAGALRSGNTGSCGCGHSENLAKRNRKHDKTRTPEYVIWSAMLDRCRNPNNKSFHLYGGRGIQVCPEWEDFSRFLADMGTRPEGMSIERDDTNGNYEAGNCRWATKLEQANNTRTNHRLTAFGETKTLAQWTRDARCVISRAQTLGKRIARGWEPEHALTKTTHTQSAEAHARALLSFTEVK